MTNGVRYAVYNLSQLRVGAGLLGLHLGAAEGLVPRRLERTQELGRLLQGERDGGRGLAIKASELQENLTRPRAEPDVNPMGTPALRQSHEAQGTTSFTSLQDGSHRAVSSVMWQSSSCTRRPQ